MGTTTATYQRKKREKESQKIRRQNNGKIKGLFKPGTIFGNPGGGASGGASGGA